MKTPAFPANEAERLAALHALRILDTPIEERFDRVTQLAVTLFGVPIAMISLVDQNREWFKSCQGLAITEGGRDISFCGHAILEDDSFVILDAALDPRFADNPQVTQQGIRFYAGHPLRDVSGHKVGTLCIKDQRPRAFGPEELKTLRALAAWAEHELNLLVLQQAYNALSKTQADLAEKYKQMEAMNKVMLGREERILELKQELQQLRGQAP